MDRNLPPFDLHFLFADAFEPVPPHNRQLDLHRGQKKGNYRKRPHLIFLKGDTKDPDGEIFIRFAVRLLVSAKFDGVFNHDHKAFNVKYPPRQGHKQPKFLNLKGQKSGSNKGKSPLIPTNSL